VGNPPRKGRLVDQLVCNGILSNFDRVRFLQVFERQPRGGSIFPLYGQFPSLGGTSHMLVAITIGDIKVIGSNGRAVLPVINNLI
jgi:hypothetical protein